MNKNMSIETYKRSMEIESFLKRVLKVKPGTRVHNDLKGLYQGIEFHDSGNGLITPSQNKKEFLRLLNYFEKAMDVLLKGDNSNYALINKLKSRMKNMTNSNDIWYLYQQIKSLNL